MSSKGVSEVVGAMLTVVVMVSAAGLIYMISYPTIFSGVDNVAYRNSIKNMVEIRELVERMKFGNEIATTKTMQLGGGSVYTANVFNLTIDGSTYQLKDLIIELSGKRIFFESGIFEEIYGKVIPISISDPSFAITSDTAYLTFYNFDSDFSAGGSKVTLNLYYNGTSRLEASDLEIESKFCNIWKDALQKAIAIDNAPITFTDDNCSDGNLLISGNIKIILANIGVR